MWHRGHLVLLVIFLVGQIVIAQNCDALLDHGLYNVTYESSEEAQKYQMYSEICSEEYSSASTAKQKRISASLSYAGIGLGGSSSGGTSSTSEQQKKYCEEHQEESSYQGSDVAISKQIYSAAIAAWERCVELQSKSLEINFSILPSSANATEATFGLRYGGASQSGIKLSGVYVNPENAFTCEGQINDKNVIFNKLTNTIVGPQQISMTCRRNITDTIVKDGETFEVYGDATISIHTTDKNLDIAFPQIEIPELAQSKANELETQIIDLQTQVTTLKTQYDGLQGIVSGIEPQLPTLVSRIEKLEQPTWRGFAYFTDLTARDSACSAANPYADGCIRATATFCSDNQHGTVGIVQFYDNERALVICM